MANFQEVIEKTFLSIKIIEKKPGRGIRNQA